jgi:hypothetical protein
VRPKLELKSAGSAVSGVLTNREDIDGLRSTVRQPPAETATIWRSTGLASVAIKENAVTAPTVRKLTSAWSKLSNATQHIAKARRILEKNSPFCYVLETHKQTGQRATYAKKDAVVIEEISVVSGDVLSNLRTALDFAYWQIVSPFVSEESARRQIQFPFCKRLLKVSNENGLEEILKIRSADKVSSDFCDAIRGLKPYGESGGNHFLYILEKTAMPERHRGFTPVGDFKSVNAELLRREAPDFPMGIQGSFGGGLGGPNSRDMVWRIPPQVLGRLRLGTPVIGSPDVYELKLNVPVDIVFDIAEIRYVGSVVPTLNKLSETVGVALATLEPFA